MTPRVPRPRRDDDDDQNDDSVLTRAADELHASSSTRWVEVADGVLSAVLSASRRSLPVLVQVAGTGARVSLSEQVIVARLRAALDEHLTHAATARINLEVTRDQRLSQLTVELLARYGAPLVPLADEARGVIRTQLASWTAGDPATTVVVRPAHVHIGDVVADDPHLSDPHDG
jgi:hypothetical protein